MLFLNLIIIKLCILHKYHLPSYCGSAGIWYSTCLEMPRIAKFRTYFCKKKFWGRTHRRPRPHFQYNFSFCLSFFCGPLPTFRRQATPLIYTNILQIWMIPHNITLFEFISVPYENQHQTLNIKKLTGAKLGFASIYLRIHVKLLDFQGGGGGDSPFHSSRWGGGGEFVNSQFASYFHHIGRFMTIKRLTKPLFIFNQQ